MFSSKYSTCSQLPSAKVIRMIIPASGALLHIVLVMSNTALSQIPLSDNTPIFIYEGESGSIGTNMKRNMQQLVFITYLLLSLILLIKFFTIL